MNLLCLPRAFAAPLSALLVLLAGCGDDDSPSDPAGPDASQPAPGAGDASTQVPGADAASADASTSQPGSGDAGNTRPRPACELLGAGEVAAVLGVAQNATELLGGLQCQFSSADSERKSVRGLLEVVNNGRAIYEANLRMYSEAGMTPAVLTGIGDQAAFLSESDVRSSIMSTRGDVLLRINLGWGDPGVDSATQLAGERTLMLKALERL